MPYVMLLGVEVLANIVHFCIVLFIYYGIFRFSCDSYGHYCLNFDKILSKCECHDHVIGTWSFQANKQALWKFGWLQ